jgi:hypothetical protein
VFRDKAEGQRGNQMLINDVLRSALAGDDPQAPRGKIK